MISEHPIDMPGTEHLLKIVQISEGSHTPGYLSEFALAVGVKAGAAVAAPCALCSVLWHCSAGAHALLLAQVGLQAGSKG